MLNARNRAEELPSIISNSNISWRELRGVKYCGADHATEEWQRPCRTDSRANLPSASLSHRAPRETPSRLDVVGGMSMFQSRGQGICIPSQSNGTGVGTPQPTARGSKLHSSSGLGTGITYTTWESSSPLRWGRWGAEPAGPAPATF